MPPRPRFRPRRKASVLAFSAVGVALAVAARAPAASFTFVPRANAFWSYQLGNGGYPNWVGNLMPVSAYDTDIHIGSSSNANPVTSKMDFASFRLKNLFLDSPTTILQGNTLSVAGGGSINAAKGTQSIANDLGLNADGAGGTTTFSVDTGGTLTATGIVSGASSLAKTGAGTLTLSGANTYSGGTTLNAGTVKLGSASALGTGDLTLTDGTLDLNGYTPTVGNLTLGSAVVAGTGSFTLKGSLTASVKGTNFSRDVELSAGGHEIQGASGQNSNYGLVLSGVLSGAGGITMTAPLVKQSTVVLTGANTYTGATSIGPSETLYLGATNTLSARSVVELSQGTLSLAPSTSAYGVVAGSYSQIMGSLTGNENSRVFLGNATLTVGGLNADGTYGGHLYGNGASIVKVGSGTQSLGSTFGDYTGEAQNMTVTVKGGTLAAGSVLGTGGTLNVMGGATFASSGAHFRDVNLLSGDGVGMGTLTTSDYDLLSVQNLYLSPPSGSRTDPFKIDANLNFEGDNAGFSNVGRLASGPYDIVTTGILQGDLHIKGGLNVALAGRTNSASLSIDSGNLFLASSSSTSLFYNVVNVPAGATLRLDPDQSASGVVSGSYDQTFLALNGAGNVSLGSATLAVGGRENSNFSGVISGTGSLVKRGGSTLRLAGRNTYTGPTKITEGNLELLTDEAFGGDSVDLRLAGGTLLIDGHSLGIKDLYLGDGTASYVGDATGGTIRLNGNILFDGIYTNFHDGRTPSIAPSISTNFVLSAGQHTLYSNGISARHYVDLPDSSGGKEFYGNYDTVLSGSLSGPGGLTVAAYLGGAEGNLFRAGLTGHSAYLGETRIAGAYLFLGTANALPATTAVIMGDGASSGPGTFASNSSTGLYLDPNDTHNGITAGSYDQTIASLAGKGLVLLGDATLTVGDATSTTFDGLIMAADYIPNGHGGYHTEYSGLFGGGTTGQLVKQGSGTLTLTNDLVYFGGTTVKEGRLVVLRPSGNYVDNAALEISNADNRTFSGVVSGTGSLTKSGAGTLTLSGSNTSTGGTIVNAGRIEANATGSIGSGPITVASGTTLANDSGKTLAFSGVSRNDGTVETLAGSKTRFTGVVSGKGGFTLGGAVEFDGGYSPGDGILNAAFGGDVILGSTNTLTLQLGRFAPFFGGNDHLQVAGSLGFGGNLVVASLAGFDPQVGRSYSLFGFATETGVFSSVTLPSLGAGMAWDRSALYSQGRLGIKAVPVPEPASLAALGLGLLGLLRRRRR